MQRTLLATLGIVALVACREASPPTSPTLSAHAVDASTAPYEAIDLGTLGGAASAATDLNDARQVVGWSRNAAGAFHAFLWDNGVMRDLGTLGGFFSWADDINDHGQVAGRSTTAEGYVHHFLWSNGVMHDIDPAGQCKDSFISLPARVNNAGHVAFSALRGVGWSCWKRAFLWRNGLATDLGAFGGSRASQAWAINDHDQVAGIAGGDAVLWDENTMHELEWHGTSAQVRDINNRGQVVGIGWSFNEGLTLHALLWQHGQVIDLGVLPGDADAFAVAINGRGQVAGNSMKTDFDGSHPFRWELGVSSPLSPTYQTDPHQLVRAMNDRGLVVGVRGGPSGPLRAVVWDAGVTWVIEQSSIAVAINNRGDFAGQSPLSGLDGHAALWRRVPAVSAAASDR